MFRLDWFSLLVVLGFCFLVVRATVIAVYSAYNHCRDHRIVSRFSIRQVLFVTTALCISAAFAQIHLTLAYGGFFITLSCLFGYLIAGRIGLWNMFCVSFSAVGIITVLAVLAH